MQSANACQRRFGSLPTKNTRLAASSAQKTFAGRSNSVTTPSSYVTCGRNSAAISIEPGKL